MTEEKRETPRLTPDWERVRELRRYLPCRAGDKAKSTGEPIEGLLVDYAADGRPIGIEIRSPGHVSVDQVNQVLGQIGMEPIQPEELAPLQAA